MKQLIAFMFFLAILTGIGFMMFNGYADRTLTIKYDNCEYVLLYYKGIERGLAHKGNCKNPIHDNGY